MCKIQSSLKYLPSEKFSVAAFSPILPTNPRTERSDAGDHNKGDTMDRDTGGLWLRSTEELNCTTFGARAYLPCGMLPCAGPHALYSCSTVQQTTLLPEPAHHGHTWLGWNRHCQEGTWPGMLRIKKRTREIEDVNLRGKNMMTTPNHPLLLHNSWKLRPPALIQLAQVQFLPRVKGEEKKKFLI